MVDELRYAGVEKIAVDEVKALNKLGQKATLLVLRRNNSDIVKFKNIINSTPIIFLSDRLPQRFQFSFRFPLFAFFSFYHITFPFLISIVFSKKDVDIIISHGTTTCLTALFLSKLRGIPYIPYIWDPAHYILGRVYSGNISKNILNLLTILGRFLDKIIVDNSKLAITGCTFHKKLLKNISNTNIEILFPSIDAAKEIQETKLNYVLVVTAWKYGKDPEFIFDIAKKYSEINFIVAGSWKPVSYKQNYLDEVRNNGLQDRIKVTGFLSEAELINYYQNARVLLQFKADIGFGMPALEAASNGCTFIIPEGQGVCDLFEDGVDGYYISEKDAESIIMHLRSLFQDSGKAYQMGFNAWKKVSIKHSLINHAYELLNITNMSNLGEQR